MEKKIKATKTDNKKVVVSKDMLRKDKNNIRFVEIDGEKYYVTIDIAKVVGKKSDFVARRVDTIKFGGYRGGMIFVSEQNLHAFIAKVEQKFPEYKKIIFEASVASKVSVISEQRVQEVIQAASKLVRVAEEQRVEIKKQIEAIHRKIFVDNKKEETVEVNRSSVQATSEEENSINNTTDESELVFIEQNESEQTFRDKYSIVKRLGISMNFEPDKKILDEVEATCKEWLDEYFPETKGIVDKIEEEKGVLKDMPQSDGTLENDFIISKISEERANAAKVCSFLLGKSILRAKVDHEIINGAKKHLAAAIAGYTNDYDTFVRDMRLFKQGKLQNEQLSRISKMEIPGTTEIQRWVLRQIFNVDPRENYPKDCVKFEEWVEYMISEHKKERMMAFERLKQWAENNPNAETIPDEFYEFFPEAYCFFTSVKDFVDDIEVSYCKIF